MPPTVSFNPPLAAPGHAATVTDAGAATSWWGGGWWGGGYPNNGLIAAPFPIPASNVLVNGSPAASASVQVAPAVYCFYGGSSSTSCNPGNGQDTPGSGALFPSQLSGSVSIPPNATRGGHRQHLRAQRLGIGLPREQHRQLVVPGHRPDRQRHDRHHQRRLLGGGV